MSDSPLYLSRVRLRAHRGEALAAIAPLLIPSDAGKRPGHAHHVLWLLFGEDANAKRDFLWRDEDDGRYLILSHRPPTDPHALFELDQKEFEPKLSVGDQLRFALRANPTMSTKAAGSSGKPDAKGRLRGKRVDVVMHALKPIAKTNWESRTGRAFERDRIVTEAATAWLARRGERAGFRLVGDPMVTGYAQVPLERRGERNSKSREGRLSGFSKVDFEGAIEVTDPTEFLGQLASGFGSAKAFGCGLMLIRRGWR